MRPEPLATILDATAETCRLTTAVDGWTPEECDLVLRGLSTVSYEIPALSARIRAARVNATKVPHPVKPLNPKTLPDPPPNDPKPDPPSEPGK